MELKFAKTIPERIILSIDKRVNYSARISKKLQASYSGINHSLKYLKSIGIIENTKCKNNRTRNITLTEKGKRIQELLKELRSLTCGTI